MATISSEDLLAALAAGPLDEDELVGVLAEAAGLGDEEWPAVDAVDDAIRQRRIFRLRDGRVASGAWLLDGMTAWHRLGKDDASDRRVRLGLDGLFHLVLCPRAEVVLVGDDAVELGAEPSPNPFELDLSVIALPDAWEPGLVAGDLVGLVLDGGHLRLVRADHQPVGDPGAGGGLRLALEELGREHSTWPTTNPLGTTDGWVLDLEDVVPDLLADHRVEIRAGGWPFEEALAATGMAHVGPLVGRAGISAERLGIFAVGQRVLASSGSLDLAPPVEEVGLLWLSLAAPEAPEGLAEEVAARLVDMAEVTSIVAGHLRQADTDVVDQVTERLRSIATASAVGPAWLLALAALRHGDAAEARRLLAAVGAASGPRPGDGWDEAWDLLGELEAIAGDIDAAQRTWRLAGADERSAQLDPWRPKPLEAVGRNERCPCGSGRKFKQCCSIRPAAPDLDAGTAFVWWKVHAWALTHHVAHVPRADHSIGPAAIDVLIFSIQSHMAEGGALAQILDAMDGLLPADEMGLARSWLATRHRLWSVLRATPGGGAELRDDVTGEVVAVPDARRAEELLPGRHVIGLVIAGPRSSHLVGHSLLVDPDALDAVRQALAAAPDEEALHALALRVVDRKRTAPSFPIDPHVAGLATGSRAPRGRVRG